ncbi:ribosomal protein S18 acetylase RimI-like enzyme [Chryseobacterium sediminis]|uniref:Ribosomal protein S18 acetylase RimI-like enzyme n=1 Tax=Chryseobacterium sediminis TaxID=1679494 RepID=A0ABR6PVH5_9FLAO|nr:GNAT family N-acetyltransferase [Chryseobacterium sediminis]MBB6329714.1 ribosomal protein S18 acetylase RimI-like enzyme [Chryseobacterium sediminis]
MTSISYRKLLPEESKIYRAIRLESLEKFPESFGATYQEAVNIEKFRIENDIEEQTPERFVYGAFSQQELVGICTFVKNENNTGSIYQMYVKKEFQGKNIGQGLIEAVIAEASQKFNGIEIILEVAPGNDKAYNLYRKIGFQEIPSTSSEEICMKYVP